MVCICLYSVRAAKSKHMHELEERPETLSVQKLGSVLKACRQVLNCPFLPESEFAAYMKLQICSAQSRPRVADKLQGFPYKRRLFVACGCEGQRTKKSRKEESKAGRIRSTPRHRKSQENWEKPESRTRTRQDPVNKYDFKKPSVLPKKAGLADIKSQHDGLGESMTA